MSIKAISKCVEELQNCEKIQSEVDALTLRKQEIENQCEELRVQEQKLEIAHQELINRSIGGEDVENELQSIERQRSNLNQIRQRRISESTTIDLVHLKEKKETLSALKAQRQEGIQRAWAGIVEDLQTKIPDEVREFLCRLHAASSVIQRRKLQDVGYLLFPQADPHDSTSPWIGLSNDDLKKLQEGLARQYGVPANF